MAAGCGSAGGHAATTHTSQPTDQPPLRIQAGPIAVELSPGQRAALAVGGARAADHMLVRLSTQRRPAGTVRLRFGPSAAVTLGRAAATTAARVTIPAQVIAVQMNLPAIRQGYRDDCEATALAMMLHARVDQYRLQALLPIARPMEPEQTEQGPVWGDPEQGFVGAVRGGGYGVYDRPLLALARRFDPATRNLTRHPLAAIIAALRTGHPVVAWIQFGRSVPRTWATTDGRTVHANFAEHTVTLTGWRPGRITYNNPWTGSRESTSLTRFAALWHTLGDRAIEGGPVFPD